MNCTLRYAVALLLVAAAACASESVRGTTALPALSPATMDFGTLVVGESRALTSTLTNNGDAALVITDFQLSGPSATQFRADVEAPLVPAGGSIVVSVRYQPGVPGAHAGRLELLGIEPALGISLTGSATEPPCEDLDEDGYGVGCPAGDDCRDDDPTVHSGVTRDGCDGIDNDCDGETDEDDATGEACDTGQPGVCAEGRRGCNGGTAACLANTAASEEQCNRLDDDCDGETDEDVPLGDTCITGGLGVCAAGHLRCVSGMRNCTPDVEAAGEICNGLDDDCDGSTDEGINEAQVACDTEVPGVCAAGTLFCSGGVPMCVPRQLAMAEACNFLDDDCDGVTDEDGVCNSCISDNDCTEVAEVCRQGTYEDAPFCHRLCTTSGDCAAGEACFSMVGSANQGFCAPHAAGAQAGAGASCAGNEFCTTGFCSASTRTCVERCARDTQCPVGTLCQKILNTRTGIIEGRCRAPAAGQLGNGLQCLGDGDCATGHCLRPFGITPGICRPLCCNQRDCGPQRICTFIEANGANSMLGCAGAIDNRGFPVGSRCTNRDDCASRFCSAQSGTCTDFCCDDSDCPASHRCGGFLTEIAGDLLPGGTTLTIARLCEPR